MSKRFRSETFQNRVCFGPKLFVWKKIRKTVFCSGSGFGFQEKMGNVQQKGREDCLSQFQRRKLKYDFYTFFGKTTPASVSNMTAKQEQKYTVSLSPSLFLPLSQAHIHLFINIYARTFTLPFFTRSLAIIPSLSHTHTHTQTHSARTLSLCLSPDFMHSENISFFMVFLPWKMMKERKREKGANIYLGINLILGIWEQ